MAYKQSQGIITVFKHSLKSEYLQIIFFPFHDLSSFPYSCPFDGRFFLIIFFVCLFIFLWFLTFIIIHFDGYYIVRTDEGQPRPKYIFNNMWI